MCVMRVACVHVRVCLRAWLWWCVYGGACVCVFHACVRACVRVGTTGVVRVCLWVVGGVRVCVVRVACAHVRVCLRGRWWWHVWCVVCVCALHACALAWLRACARGVCACVFGCVVGGVRVCAWCGLRACMRVCAFVRGGGVGVCVCVVLVCVSCMRA